MDTLNTADEDCRLDSFVDVLYIAYYSDTSSFKKHKT